MFSHGPLYKILSNPVYIGRLGHKGQVYQGQHPAIVDQEIWERTQAGLAEKAQLRVKPTRPTEASLAGKLFDDRGFHMSPSEAAKGAKRWRCYVSQAIRQGHKGDAGSLPRVSAAAIEGAVRAALSDRRPCEEMIEAGLEKVVVGKTNLTIRWRDGQQPEGPALDLPIPWSPTPTRKRREIVQGDDKLEAGQRPMSNYQAAAG